MMLIYAKKVISINYGSSISSWKPWRWVRLDLILTMRDTYIDSNLNSLTKFTNSSISTQFKDIFPWSSSQMITKTVPISTRIVISYAMKRDIQLWIWWKSIKTETKIWSEFSNGRKAIVEQNNSVRRNKEIQKSRTVRITVWDLGKKVNHPSKVVWDLKAMIQVY